MVGALSPLGTSRVSFEHICTEKTPLFNRTQRKHSTDGFVEQFCTHKCRQHVVIDSGGSVVELVLQGGGDGYSANGLGGTQ